MKNILVTIILTSVSVCVFAQKTNNKGEYMVKSYIGLMLLLKKRLATKGISGIVSSITMMET